MAIINNNVQNVQFLRNQTPYASREAALTAIEAAKANAIDGTSLLARYSGGTVGEDFFINTIVGYVAVNGNDKYLTIIDVEGSSADVEELKQEINAKLGNGVSSANTVTDQLAALSGTPGASSADTSVEGAKSYADAKIQEAITDLDYTGVTTGDGVYVTNVTEVDGIVSATTATLPSVTDAKEAKKVVVSVSENNGEISIERGTISSTAETMVLTDNTDGGVNFEVNIDNNTIIQDAETKKLKVVDAALVQYEGDTKTIEITPVVNGVRTVSTLLTLSSVTPSSTTVKEEYALKNASGETIGSTIKIYKDSSIVEINYITDPADEHYQNLEYIYIDASGNTQTEYVDMTELVLEAEFASGVTFSNGVAHGVVDQQSETFLTVGANGFKLAGVQDAIDAAVDGLDATVSNSGNSGHVGVEIVEENGKLVSVTVSEDGIANADGLAELSGKTITAITSNNASITATIDDAVGNKSYNIETDASKIKMSGFTSTDALSGITSSSSVTEAFKEVDRVITENEQTTAAALTDLDERLDTIESDFISGITVNGSGVNATDNIAALTIVSAPATGTDSSPIDVATSNNGGITLTIQNIDCGYYDGTV